MKGIIIFTVLIVVFCHFAIAEDYSGEDSGESSEYDEGNEVDIEKRDVKCKKDSDCGRGKTCFAAYGYCLDKPKPRGKRGNIKCKKNKCPRGYGCMAGYNTCVPGL